MLDAQMITDRRLAYANCAAEAGDLLRRKRPTCSARELAALRQRLWLLLWAKHVMCSYVLEDEECQGQWKPTDDDARCAMKLADPCCVKCGCSTNPAQTTPPSPPCNIVRNILVRRAVDASEYTVGIANLKVYVVSNVQNVTNPWSPYVGYVVQGVQQTVVPTGWVVYASVGASYWIQTASGPGAYFPQLSSEQIDPTHITVTSAWPLVNNYQDYQVIVEAMVDGVWTTIYSGADNLSSPQTYEVDGIASSARYTYLIGNCKYGPYQSPLTVFVPVCGTPDLSYQWVSAGGGLYDLEVTMATSADFTPGNLYVEQDGVNSSPQTFGALPDTLTFTGLDGTNPVTLHLINLVAGCAPYVENLGVPALCQGDGYVAFTSDGTAELTVYTTSGHYAIRNRTTQVVTEYNSGTGSSLIPAGSYCLFSSTEGEQYGNMGQVFMTGGCSGIVVNQSYMNVYSAVNLPISNTYDFTANTSIVEMEIDNSASGTLDLSTLPLNSATIKNNTTLTTVLLNPGISIGDPINIDSDLSNNAFDVATVDAFCNGLDPLATGGVTDISGGTNAAPTAASLSARNAYIAAGNTLITN